MKDLKLEKVTKNYRLEDVLEIPSSLQVMIQRDWWLVNYLKIL